MVTLSARNTEEGLDALYQIVYPEQNKVALASAQDTEKGLDALY